MQKKVCNTLRSLSAVEDDENMRTCLYTCTSFYLIDCACMLFSLFLFVGDYDRQYTVEEEAERDGT